MLAFAREKLFAPLRISVEKELIFKDKEEQMAFKYSCPISAISFADNASPQPADCSPFASAAQPLMEAD